MTTIINFFGDSICFGQGVSIEKTWVVKLSGYLANSGYDVLVQNKATNGRTTRQALENMSFEIQYNIPKTPDILLIQFGMNDCNLWETDRGLPRVKIESFESNLSEIIDRAKHFKIEKIFLNTNHPTLKNELLHYAPFTYQQNNRRYNHIIRKVANANNITLFDMEEAFKSLHLENVLLKDGLHLNENGHDIYLEYIKVGFEEYLERRTNRKENI